MAATRQTTRMAARLARTTDPTVKGASAVQREADLPRFRSLLGELVLGELPYANTVAITKFVHRCLEWRKATGHRLGSLPVD